MSPIWRANERNEMIRAFESKADLRIKLDDIAGRFVAERHVANELRGKIATDNIAWKDLMHELMDLREEVKLLRSAEAWRTKERDALALRVENIDAEAAAMAARIDWVLRQHQATSAVGRCVKCNVGWPCKTIRVLTGEGSV